MRIRSGADALAGLEKKHVRVSDASLRPMDSSIRDTASESVLQHVSGDAPLRNATPRIRQPSRRRSRVRFPQIRP